MHGHMNIKVGDCASIVFTFSACKVGLIKWGFSVWSNSSIKLWLLNKGYVDMCSSGECIQPHSDFRH